MSYDPGPQQASPFDNLDPEQRAYLDQRLAVANGIMLYNSARRSGVAVGAEWRPQAEQLARRGGLTPQEALILGQYKMWKEGAPVIPTERQPAQTKEEIDDYQRKFLASDPATKAKMWREAEQRTYASQLGHYDTLVQPQEQPASQPIESESQAIPGKKKEVPS